MFWVMSEGGLTQGIVGWCRAAVAAAVQGAEAVVCVYLGTSVG